MILRWNYSYAIALAAGHSRRGGFEICIDGLSIWLMRIAREIGRGTSVQALRE
jgi:hypothetical protein